MYKLFWAAFVGLASICWNNNSQAADFTWDLLSAGTNNGQINGGGGSWDTTTLNWTSDGGATNIAWANTAADKAIFSGAGGTVSINDALVANALQFHSTGYTLAPGGGSLILDGVAPTISVTNAQDTVTISAALNGIAGLTIGGAGTVIASGNNGFSGPLTVSSGGLVLSGAANTSLGAVEVQTGGVLTVTDPLNVEGAAASLTNVTVRAGGTFVIQGTNTANIDAINTGPLTWEASANFGIDVGATVTYATAIGDSAGGARGLVKLGAGELTLSGANTFSGPLTLSAGSLVLSGSANPNQGAVDVRSGTTLIITDPANITGAAAALSNVTVRTSATLMIRGNSAANIDAVNSGAINWAAGATFAIDTNSGPVTYSNAIGDSSAGVRHLLKTGADVLTLSGVANTYSGLTTISQGSLNVQHAGSLGSTAAGTVVVAGATLQLQGGVTITGEHLDLNGEGLSAGGALRNIDGNNTWAGSINANTSAIVRIASDAGLLTVSGNIVTNNSFERLVLQGNGDILVSGVISGPGRFTRSSNGAGTVTLTGANTFTGQIAISAGTLAVTSLNSVGGGSPSSNLGAPQTVAAGTLDMSGNGRLLYTGTGETTNRVIHLNGGAIIDSSGAGPLVFTSSPTASTGARVLTLQGANSGANEFQAVIGNSAGTVGLAKAGPGTWTLTAANTYTGSTTVSDGILKLAGGDNRLPSTTALTVNAPGALELNGLNQTVGSLAGSGTVANSGNADVTLTIGGTGAGIFSGALSDGPTNKLALVRTGSGSLTLGGGATDTVANSFQGGATLTSGALVLNKADGTTALPGNIVINGGTLHVARNHQIADAAAITLTGGTLSFSNGTTNGSNEVIGSLTQTGGNVILSAVSTALNNVEIAGTLSVSGATTGFSNSSGAAGSANQLILTDIVYSAGGATSPGFLIASNSAGRVTTFTVGGGGLTLNSSIISLGNDNVQMGSSLILNGNVVSNGTSAVSLGPGSTATKVSVDLGGGTRTLEVPSVSDVLTINIPVINGGLIKTGAGVLELGGNSTYAGGLTLQAGTLRIGLNAAAGAGPLTLAGGTYTSASSTTRTFTAPVNITGDMTLGDTVTGTGSLVFSGAGTYSGNRNLTPLVNTTFSGGLAGAGVLTRTGVGTATMSLSTTAVALGGLVNTGDGGTLTVSAPLTLTGNLTQSATSALTLSGNLDLGGGARTFGGDGTGTVTVSGIVSNGGIVKTGSHLLVFGNSGNTFTGGVTIHNGVLQVASSAAAFNTTGLNPVAMTGGTLRLNGLGTTIGDLSGTGGIVENSHATTASTVTINKSSSSSLFSGALQNGGTAALGLTKNGGGTLTLNGTNTYTGGTRVNNGTLVLDYSGAADTADPLSTSVLTLDGGTVVFQGKTTGVTTETVSALNTGLNVAANSTVTLAANGGGGVNLTISSLSLNATATAFTNLIDLSSSAGNSIAVSALGATTAMKNGVLQANSRANHIVKNATGYGFATLSGTTSGTLGRLTTFVPLTTSGGGTNTTNYRLTVAETTGGTQTRTTSVNFGTLTIDADAGGNTGPLTLNMGANNFSASGDGRGVLIVGAQDVNITGTGVLVPGNGSGSTAIWFHNYSTGTFNLGLSTSTFSGNTVVFGGAGFTNWSGLVGGGQNLYFGTGLIRVAAAQDLTVAPGASAAYYVNSGGVFEIGADLNGATAGDLSNAVGAAAGQFRFFNDSGLSASGANRVVNFGGAGAALTWGAGAFLTNSDVATDGNSTFKLSSARSTATLEVQNPIVLGARQRVVDVADGTAATDAILSGVLSGSGGLQKTGPGTLQLTAANTYTGGTSVLAGTLAVTALTNGTNTTVAAGATLTAGQLTQTSLVNDGAVNLLAGGTNTLATLSGTGTVNNHGTTTITSGGAIGSLAGSGSLTLANNATLTTNSLRQTGAAGLTLSGDAAHTSAKVTINASGNNAAGAASGVSHLAALTIGNDNGELHSRTYFATLDLMNNDLVIDNPVATTGLNDNSASLSQLAAVQDLVRSGAANNWTGPGLTSSYAATTAGNLNVNNGTGLGVIRNVLDPGAAFNVTSNPARYAAFDELALGGNEILVKYTYYGDADLDGRVTSFDFALLDAGFAGTRQLDGSTGWFFGDFDYSGGVDVQDYALLNAGYLAYSGGGVPSVLPPNTQLPEPTTFALAALSLVGLIAARVASKRRPATN